ncbi:ABC transporter ATP-binding protein [bacterium]|nr:ABC transporter ATP-binding protein [candidate division CSSED10-310 bacterium]
MLEIRNLVKVYPGPVAALQGIDLQIENGMFGLLGPNGAGKTTLMRIIAGLLEPTSGQVFFDGADIVRNPDSIRHRLGYLPQEFGFYPNLTGEAMLVFLLKLKGISAPGGIEELTRDLLGRVNLTFAARRRIKGYSGGMRQRLGVAQAIAGDPSIIVVDEPTAGLDPEERLRFYRILAELAEDRIVLLSTHIVEDVAVLCSKFAVIRNGRLIALTTPSEARETLKGRIFEGTADNGRLRDIETTHCVTKAMLIQGTNHLRVYSPAMDPPAGFQETTPTLEDAYLALMARAAAERPVSGKTSR